ncbi:MAG: CRISPR-associated endonuclease Cas2 [Candidatus Korarchaeum sp.]
MKTLVVYDISDDALRNRVAELLKDLGLARIQRSAFIGELSDQERRDLEVRMVRLGLGERDRVDIFPICERDLKVHSSVTRREVRRGVPKPDIG